MSANTPSAKGSRGTGVLGTLYHQRWLLSYFVRHQLTRSYQGSVLGFAWAFLSPLIWVFFLTIIFSEIVGLRFKTVEGNESLNFGLYLYCGLLPFMAYSEALSKGINSIRTSSSLVQKVTFPLEILPFATAITSLIDKIFGIGALLAVLLVLEHQLHWTVLLVPLFMVPQMLFVMGLTFLMAVAGTYLPDIGEVLRPIVRGTFFLTPILWPVDRVPERLRFIVDYNPLAYLVEGYRDLILNGELPGEMATIYFSLFAGALFVLGLALFVRAKPWFAEWL